MTILIRKKIMKRILFVHQVSSIGGGSFCLLNIIKEIDRSTYEPVVCLSSDGPLKSEVEKLGVKVVLFPQMSAIPYNQSLMKASSINAYIKIRKSISSFKLLLSNHSIDIVYLNNMMIYSYLKPSKECGCRTIIHVREHWPLNEHTRQLQWARDAVYKYADGLIAINNYSASIFPNKQATIVYDWIDMDSRFEYRPMDEILGEDARDLKVYLFLGGVQKIKGAKEVIESFSTVVKDPDSRLLILGITPEYPKARGLKSKISMALHRYGIRKIYALETIDLINSDSRIKCIPSTYYLSHIIQQSYCNLSFFTIPHANLVLVECILLGIPSIAAETEESLEYSLQGELALLFNINDKYSFCKAIASFESQRNQIQERIMDKRNQIKCMFDKQDNIRKLIDLINKV